MLFLSHLSFCRKIDFAIRISRISQWVKKAFTYWGQLSWVSWFHIPSSLGWGRSQYTADFSGKRAHQKPCICFILSFALRTLKNGLAILAGCVRTSPPPHPLLKFVQIHSPYHSMCSGRWLMLAEGTRKSLRALLFVKCKNSCLNIMSNVWHRPTRSETDCWL